MALIPADALVPLRKPRRVTASRLALSYRWTLAAALCAAPLAWTTALPARAATPSSSAAAKRASDSESLPQDPKERADWLQVQNAALKARVDLAQKGEFYLLLDPASARLKLMLKGATLQSYPIESIRVGRPRVAYKQLGSDPQWVGRIWSKGQLTPQRERERVEIIAPPVSNAAESDTATGPTVPIPPTPEEAFEVPAMFWVRYAPGLSLEVLAAEPKPGEKPEPRQERPSHRSVWWRNALSAIRAAERDQVRVQLTLSSTDAASLYRCLPPDAALLVLPPP